MTQKQLSEQTAMLTLIRADGSIIKVVIDKVDYSSDVVQEYEDGPMRSVNKQIRVYESRGANIYDIVRMKHGMYNHIGSNGKTSCGRRYSEDTAVVTEFKLEEIECLMCSLSNMAHRAKEYEALRNNRLR